MQDESSVPRTGYLAGRKCIILPEMDLCDGDISLSGGYWVDGCDHDTPFDGQGNPIISKPIEKPKFDVGEREEVARCYRKHFYGRVSSFRVHVFHSSRCGGWLFPIP